VQNLHEVGGTELGGSTRGLDLLRQPNALFLRQKHRSHCNSIRLGFQSSALLSRSLVQRTGNAEDSGIFPQRAQSEN
jgi:hypothetical protein